MSRRLSTLKALIVLLLAGSAIAQSRKPIDPAGPLARRAGQITQLDIVYEQRLPANETRLVGNAVIISPCKIITNYHVAFGKSKKTDTKRVVLIKNRIQGHTVDFEFSIDGRGQFTRRTKAKVISFANYINTSAGILGDMALLELETFVDKKDYSDLDLEMASSPHDVPTGKLMTVSVGLSNDGKVQILAQEGCQSEKITPINGLFMASCESVPGMSGAAVYELGADRSWHWTGLISNHTVENGVLGLIAINSKTIAGFLRRSGQGPNSVAPNER